MLTRIRAAWSAFRTTPTRVDPYVGIMSVSQVRAAEGLPPHPER